MSEKIIIKTEAELCQLADILKSKKLSLPLILTYGTSQKRTLPQNALLWKWNEEVSAFLKKKDGLRYAKWDKEKVYEMHCHTFLGWRTTAYVDICTGIKKEKETLVTSSKLDKEQFQSFMDQIYYYWADKLCFLTVPELSEYKRNKKE